MSFRLTVTLFEREPSMRTQDVRKEVVTALAGSQFSLMSTKIFNDKRKNHRRFKLFIKKLNEEFSPTDDVELLEKLPDEYNLYFIGHPCCCSFTDVACVTRKAAL